LSCGGRVPVPGRHSLLRLYIEAEAGVQVDDCARVSEQVGAVLDVEEPIGGEYTLEVSSPGMDRRLFTLEQYPPTSASPGGAPAPALRGASQVQGVLRGVEGEDIVVLVDDHEYLLPFGDVRRRSLTAAHLNAEAYERALMHAC
jgi:ribosome maturation factor RimP